MGNPKNIASAIAIPNDSEYEGKIKAEASLKTLHLSSLNTAPFNSIFLFKSLLIIIFFSLLIYSSDPLP